MDQVIELELQYRGDHNSNHCRIYYLRSFNLAIFFVVAFAVVVVVTITAEIPFNDLQSHIYCMV